MSQELVEGKLAQGLFMVLRPRNGLLLLEERVFED